MSKRTSWDYQRFGYKQIGLKFNMSKPEDASLYEFIKEKQQQRLLSALLKRLLFEQMKKEEHPCYGCFGATFNDCVNCDKYRRR